MQINKNSPFQQTNLKPIEEPYSYEASVFGLRLPTGKIMINFDQSTKYSMLLDIARVIHAEVVTVKGTWTFEPAREEEEPDPIEWECSACHLRVTMDEEVKEVEERVYHQRCFDDLASNDL